MGEDKDDKNKREKDHKGEKHSGKAKGGYARKDALTPSERKAIAAKAAAARWAAARPLRATHKGNFQQDFGIDVDCYVLDDEQKTAVISQRGMGTALGLVDASGRALPRFLQGEKVASYVGGELREKLENPLVFQAPMPVSKAPVLTHGYDVTILIDVCKAIIAAEDEGTLLRRQAHIAKQAHVILNASAKAGIKGLVYALVGYDATKEETIAAFKFYVRDEAREYEKEFPNQLYTEWYRLYEMPEVGTATKPWKFKQLTVDQVYHPLARSNGKVLALVRALKAKSGDRRKKLHQFLSEIGVKALRTHLGQLLGIALVSEDRGQYERHFEKVFGQQLALPFSDPA
jgi:P63C domain-containing protein